MSKRRRFLMFSKVLNRFFRVFTRDGFNFCPVTTFHSEAIDKAHSLTYD